MTLPSDVKCKLHQWRGKQRDECNQGQSGTEWAVGHTYHYIHTRVRYLKESKHGKVGSPTIECGHSDK